MEAMTEEGFWALIQRTGGDAERVTAELKKLGPERTREFSDIYWAKHRALHRWDVWGAGYVIMGGMGDDSFHYFKAWLIGKGKKVYETPLDDLGPFVDDPEEVDNELLNYAAVEAYEALTGEELDYESGEFEDPSGDRWDEESGDLDRLFPKLTAQFG